LLLRVELLIDSVSTDDEARAGCVDPPTSVQWSRRGGKVMAEGCASQRMAARLRREMLQCRALSRQANHWQGDVVSRNRECRGEDAERAKRFLDARGYLSNMQ
jgi:hypothetical protein